MRGRKSITLGSSTIYVKANQTSMFGLRGELNSDDLRDYLAISIRGP